ncbi:TPA: hypothetical protein SLG40_001528 [Serratia odorifera]|nr:hypothetical protein [Serratia odorifera]
MKLVICSGAVLGLICLLSGCVSPEQQAAMDRAQCSGYGFKADSVEFAQCMQKIDIHRDEMLAAENAQWQQRMALEERKKARQDDKHNSTNTVVVIHRDTEETLDKTPAFDRQGNPNFDADGNYQGPHGIGALVGPEDNPDLNPNLGG